MSISVAIWTGLCSFRASRITSFFAISFVHLPCRQLFELLPFLVHCCFCIRNFHRLGHGNELVHKMRKTQRVEPLPQCDLRDLLMEPFPNTSSQSHELLRCMHASIFGFGWIRYKFPWCHKELFVVISLQGIAASTGSSNFSLRFKMGSLNPLTSC